MFALLSFLIFFLATSLQLTLIPRWAILGSMPNLLLVLIILWSTLFGFKRSFWLAILFGFLLDTFSGKYFGLFTLSLLIIAFLVDLLNEYIFGRNYLVTSLVSVTIFNIILTALFNWLGTKSFIPNYKLIIIFIVSLIFHLLLIILLLPLTERLKEKIEIYEKRAKLPF